MGLKRGRIRGVKKVAFKTLYLNIGEDEISFATAKQSAKR